MCIISTNSLQNNSAEECKSNILLSETRYSVGSYCKIMVTAQTLKVLLRILRYFAHGLQSAAFRQVHLFFIHLLAVPRHFQ